MSKNISEDRINELIDITAGLIKVAAKTTKPNGQLLIDLTQAVLNLETARAQYWKATANSWEAVVLKASYDSMGNLMNKLKDVNPPREDLDFGKEMGE